MSGGLSGVFSDPNSDVRGKVLGICVLLIAANVAAWLWALAAFHAYPVLLGTAFLAYTFGLRHAFDADRGGTLNRNRDHHCRPSIAL
jgi:high-affinity nickel-transport protein